MLLCRAFGSFGHDFDLDGLPSAPPPEYDRLEWIKSASKLSLRDSSRDIATVYEKEGLQHFLDEFELCERPEILDSKMSISSRKGALKVDGTEYPVYLSFPKYVSAEAILKVKRGSESICLVNNF